MRALGKTMQQVFRGMRHVPGWPDEANRCDLYAADDSGVVDTLRWIAAEEQAGIKKTSKQGGEGLPAPAEREVQHSVWELKSVTQGASQTTSIEQMPGYKSAAQFHAAPPVPEKRPEALDIAKRERALRRECATLARDLAFALDTPARPVAARDVHPDRQGAPRQGAGRPQPRRARAQKALARAKHQGGAEWCKRLRGRRVEGKRLDATPISRLRCIPSQPFDPSTGIPRRRPWASDRLRGPRLRRAPRVDALAESRLSGSPQGCRGDVPAGASQPRAARARGRMPRRRQTGARAPSSHGAAPWRRRAPCGTTPPR